MGWVSPTSFENPGGIWEGCADAYDGNLGTSAECDQSTESFDLLLSSAIQCTKVRVYAMDSGTVGETDDFDVLVRVYYENAWHTIKLGTIPNDTWTEIEIPAGEKTVSKARFGTDDLMGLGMLREFEFWEVAAAGISIPVAMHHYRNLREA